MKEFIKVPATKKSLANRKLVYGAGVNDSWYMTSNLINGERQRCKVYIAWNNLLKRCYCPVFKSKRKTYEDACICSEWLKFSVFAEWFEANYIEGYELDKDVKIKGNKLYSPNTCLLVPRKVNLLMNTRDAARGEYPLGVSFNKKARKYQAQLSIDCKHTLIGYFESPSEAGLAYKLGKNKEIRRKMIQYPEFSKYLGQHLYTTSCVM